MAMPIDSDKTHHSAGVTPIWDGRRLKDPSTENNDRNVSVAIHLTPLLACVFFPLIFTPLVLWLVWKDKSSFVDDHGRELMNFMISFLLMHLILVITVVGIVFIPVIWIIGLVNMIRGAVAAGNSEYFRYPMTFRFLK